MIQEVEHYTNEAPWYASKDASNQWDKYITEWNGPDDLDHGAAKVHKRVKRHPVVFDIETTAQLPQRPILWTVYDSKTGEASVCYDRFAGPRELNPEKVANVVGQKFKERGLYANPISVFTSVTPKEFELSVVKAALNDRSRVLVGHNLFFDLNIAGRPNDGLISSLTPGWQAATEYGDFSMLSKRAGAYGHIYSVISHRDMDLDYHLQIADTRVAAKSMLIGGSLEAACNEFDIAVEKGGVEHGKLTYDYIAYNVGDVASTHALYHELRRRLQMDFGAKAAPENIYSTASIFKDVMRRMGYDRVHYPKEALKIISPSYFGGRTEARRPGELIHEVTYTDVLSEYPTVCALSDVWRFMQCNEVRIESFDVGSLPAPTRYTDLAEPEVWAQMADYYCVVKAEGQLLPVRTRLPFSDTTRVYNAQVTHAEGMTTTHHFYDVVSSWLLSGEWPEVVAAFRVEPVGRQTLTDANIGGRRIDANDDVLRCGIEERKAVEREYGKGPREQSLKITANSGYGVAAERLVAGDTAHLGSKKHDIAGTYYNPHVASTITAGGRLMLAYGERVANEYGGKVHYCDTDSMIIDDRVVAPTQAAFDSLNPYGGPAGEKDVLEVESVKLDGSKRELRGVSLYAVGEKKYAILDGSELLKFTEHGLGHYEHFRDPDAIRRFWATLLEISGVDVSGERLSIDELDTPMIFQQPASTRRVRETISQLAGCEVRYGDWIQQTISGSKGSSARYIGTNLNDRVLKIDDHEVKEVLEVDPSHAMNAEQVVKNWFDLALLNRANPEVRIVGKKPVTKESATVELNYIEVIESALNAVDMEWLFG